MKKPSTVAILGAGKLGTVLSQLAVAAGYDVIIAGSGDPSSISLSMRVLVPAAQVAYVKDAAKQADIVVLAMPLSKFKSIEPAVLADKVVIDAMNYWWEVDGPELASLVTSSSEMVQSYFSESIVVKALSHMGYHHLHDEARPPDAPQRKAIALTSDNQAALQVVAGFIHDIGFDPLPIGPLAAGKQLEPGMPAFGANVNKANLVKLLK